MADFDEHRPTSAEQYRERAKRVRYTAQAVRSALLRDDLLDVAEEYESVAESLEETREPRGNALGRLIEGRQPDSAFSSPLAQTERPVSPPSPDCG
jgi:hypothetical protein